METTEAFERHMREVLHGEDDKAAGFTAAQVIVGGRHRRRARTAAVSGVALVAAGAVAVVPSAVIGGHGHGRGDVVSAAGGPVQSPTSVPSSAVRAVPTSPVSSAASTSTSSASVPSVRVVKPAKVDLGGGYALTLTADSQTLICPDGQVGPHYTDNGNQGPDSIGIQTCGAAIAGLYIGKDEAASGTVTVDGKAYPTTIVTLAGHPGWSVAYAILPTFPSMHAQMSISVSNAAGHQLASFTNPPHKG